MRNRTRNVYPGFWVAFGLMFFTFVGMAMPEWLVSRDWGDIGQPSALQLTLEPIYFGGVMLMFPFAASTVFAPQQAEEIQSGFLFLRLIRSNILRYGLTQIRRNMLRTAGCFAAAFLAHALLFHLLALPSMPEIYEAHEIPYGPDCIYAPWLPVAHGLPIVLWVAVMMGFTASVWSTLGLAVAVWVPDRLLTISVPVFVYYVLSSRTVIRLSGNLLPHAADLYNDALTAPMVVHSMSYLILLGSLFSLFYLLGLRRRMRV